MKKVAVVLLFIAFTSAVNAQINTIYGLARNSNPPGIYFASIDPGTGTVSNISGNSLSDHLVIGGATIDRSNDIYYFRTQDRFFGIDMTTGNVASSPVIQSFDNFFAEFHYNCANGKIYGLSMDASGGYNGLYLSTIDKNSGIINQISATPVGSEVITGSSILNIFNQKYYFTSMSGIVTVDLLTGTMVSNAPIITNPGQDFISCVFNPADNKIYGLAKTMTDFYLASIDPVTGIVTNISSSSIASSFNITSATIDVNNNTFYFQTEGKFVGVDITSGTIINQPIVNNGQGEYFDLFKFGFSCGPIDPPDDDDEILTSPNPGASEIHVTFPVSGNYDLEILDIFGKSVYKGSVSKTSAATLDLTALPEGNYFLKVAGEGQEYKSRIILVK